MENNSYNPNHKRQDKDTNKPTAKQLVDVLYEKPISRRMAATLLGFPDQTYMVTQDVKDLIKAGHIQAVKKVKCERSGKFVQGITSNPEFFITVVNNQLNLFDLWR